MHCFQQLYEDYYKDVFCFILNTSGFHKDLVEELTQETFYQAIKTFSKFRGDCNVKTWLFQIAKNTFYQHLRISYKTKNYSELLVINNVESVESSPQEQIEQKELLKIIHTIIESCDDKTRAVLLYRLYSDIPYSQIASLLKISESSAKVIFFRGKIRLQKKLREVYGYEI